MRNSTSSSAIVHKGGRSPLSSFREDKRGSKLLKTEHRTKQQNLSISGMSSRLSKSTSIPFKNSMSQSSLYDTKEVDNICKICERSILDIGGYCVFSFESQNNLGKKEHSIYCLQHFSWRKAAEESAHQGSKTKQKSMIMQWNKRTKEFRPVSQISVYDPVIYKAFSQLVAIVGPDRITEPGILLDTREASPACAYCRGKVENQKQIWFCLDCNSEVASEEEKRQSSWKDSLSRKTMPHQRKSSNDIDNQISPREGGTSGRGQNVCFSARVKEKTIGEELGLHGDAQLSDRASIPAKIHAPFQSSKEGIPQLQFAQSQSTPSLILLCHKHFLSPSDLPRHDLSHLMIYLQHDQSEDRVWNPLPFLARQSPMIHSPHHSCAICKQKIYDTRWSCLECIPKSPLSITFDLCHKHFRTLHLQAKLHDVNHLMRKLQWTDSRWEELVKAAPKRNLKQVKVALVCSSPDDDDVSALCPKDFVNSFHSLESCYSYAELHQFNNTNQRWYTTISKDQLLLRFSSLNALIEEMKALPLVDFFLAQVLPIIDLTIKKKKKEADQSDLFKDNSLQAPPEHLLIGFCKIGDTIFMNNEVLDKSKDGFSLLRTMMKLNFSTFFSPDLGSKFLQASICRVCGQRFRNSQPRFYCTHVECNTKKFMPYELCQLHFYTHVNSKSRESPSSLAECTSAISQNTTHKPWHKMAELQWQQSKRKWEVVGLVTQIKLRKGGNVSSRRNSPNLVRQSKKQKVEYIKTDQPSPGDVSSTYSSPVIAREKQTDPLSPFTASPGTAAQFSSHETLGVSPLQRAASSCQYNTFFSSQSQEMDILGRGGNLISLLEFPRTYVFEYPCVTCGRDLLKIGHCLRATPDTHQVEGADYAEFQCLQCFSNGPHPYMGPPFVVDLLRAQNRRDWIRVMTLSPNEQNRSHFAGDSADSILERLQRLLKNEITTRRACDLCNSPFIREKWLCIDPSCLSAKMKAICDRHFLSKGSNQSSQIIEGSFLEPRDSRDSVEPKRGLAHAMLSLRMNDEEGIWEVATLETDTLHERECSLKCALCNQPLMSEKLYWRCNECCLQNGDPFIICHKDFFEMNIGASHSIYHKMAKFVRDTRSNHLWAMKGSPDDQASYFNAAIDMAMAEEELQYADGGRLKKQRQPPSAEIMQGSFMDTKGFEKFLQEQNHGSEGEELMDEDFIEQSPYEEADNYFLHSGMRLQTQNSLDDISNKSVKESALDSRGDDDFEGEEEDQFPMHMATYTGRGKLTMLESQNFEDEEHTPPMDLISPTGSGGPLGGVQRRQKELREDEKSMVHSQRTLFELLLEKEVNKSRPGLISKRRAPSLGTRADSKIFTARQRSRILIVRKTFFSRLAFSLIGMAIDHCEISSDPDSDPDLI